MASKYKCPRCGEPVERGSSTTAAVAGGLIGGLLAAAFGAFNCEKCGKIPSSEFSDSDRQKMRTGSIALVITAVVIAVVAIWLIVTFLGD